MSLDVDRERPVVKQTLRDTKLGGFHPVVCTCNSILYLTVVKQQCVAMLLLCNYQLSDMFRPYWAIIRLYKMVLDKVHAVNPLLCNLT